MILSIETVALGAVAYCGRAKNGPAFLLTTKPIPAINLQYRVTRPTPLRWRTRWLAKRKIG